MEEEEVVEMEVVVEEVQHLDIDAEPVLAYPLGRHDAEAHPIGLAQPDRPHLGKGNIYEEKQIQKS